jgi:chaperonin cofactor prefoldin
MTVLKAQGIKLEEQLKIGPMKDQIDALSNSAKTLSFNEIIAGMSANKAIIDELGPKYDSQSQQLKILKQDYKDIGDQVKEMQKALDSSADAAQRQVKAASGGGGSEDTLPINGKFTGFDNVQDISDKVQEFKGRVIDFKAKTEELRAKMSELKDKFVEIKQELQPLTDLLGIMFVWFSKNRDLMTALIVTLTIYKLTTIALQGAILLVNGATVMVRGTMLIYHGTVMLLEAAHKALALAMGIGAWLAQAAAIAATTAAKVAATAVTWTLVAAETAFKLLIGGIQLVSMIASFAAYTAAKIVHATATWALVAAQTALNVVMSINPFVLIVIGIIALIAAIVLVIKHWDEITAKFPILQTVLDAAFQESCN